MGAEYCEHYVEAADEAELRTKVNEIIEQSKYDYGHAGYTGTFAEVTGVTVVKQAFEDDLKAKEYVEENAQKWENALAVKLSSGKYYVGAVCSS